MLPIEVIINAGSGSVLEGETDKTLTERFIALGVKANVHLAEGGEEIIELAKKAAAGDCEISSQFHEYSPCPIRARVICSSAATWVAGVPVVVNR